MAIADAIEEIMDILKVYGPEQVKSILLGCAERSASEQGTGPNWAQTNSWRGFNAEEKTGKRKRVVYNRKTDPFSGY